MEAHAAQSPVAPPRARQFRLPGVGAGLGRGYVVLWLSIIVLLPLAAVVAQSFDGGVDTFWNAVTSRQAVSALRFTILASLAAAAINALFGTLIAWVLVRDQFPGKAAINALIDLPYALPTIVAGLVLLSLYGPDSPLGVDLAYSRAGVVVALLFVTLPFVVRTVQPVLLELDTEMEQAAASLGAGPGMTFRRIILPNLMPAMVSGAALAFTRSIAEFGSTVLISGNLPFKTEVAAVNIFGQIESDNTTGAAAVSVVLLAVALVVLMTLDVVHRWGARRG